MFAVPSFFGYNTTFVSTPVATAATGVGETSFTANWNAFAGASYYLLDVSTSSSFSSFVGSYQNFVVLTTSQLVSGLTASTTYYYRLRAATGVDADAASFFSRVYTAGGALSYTEVSATETLVADLKANSLWTPMKAIYPMVGASAAACAQNLKSSSFTGSFTSGWTFASTGATPNGTSAYMETSLVPSTQLSSNNASIGYYGGTTGTSNKCALGAGTLINTSLLEIYPAIAGYGLFGDVFDGSNTFTANTNAAGFIFAYRNSSTTQKKHSIRGTITTQTESTTTGTIIASVVLAARKVGTSTLQDYSNFQHRFAFMGDGLTDTQASNFYTAVQAFNQTLNRQVGAQVVSDADAQAYINRVYTAGGTLTNTEATAVNQLTIDMKAAGVWTAMKAVYPMVGASAAACAQNLKSSSFTGTFSSGWSFDPTGVIPNGTSAYMDTGFNPVTQSSSQTSFYMSVYIRTNSNAGFPYDIGNATDWNTGVKFTGIITRYNTNTRYIAVCDPYSTGNSETDSRGFYSGGTNGSSAQILYKNGSNVLSGTSLQQGFQSNNLYISAVNSSVGGAAGFSAKQNAFASISDGLSPTQNSNLYTAVQAFQTTLARQV